MLAIEVARFIGLPLPSRFSQVGVTNKVRDLLCTLGCRLVLINEPALPNLRAGHSHPRVDELDSATATTRHFDNGASCFSLGSTTASYQEALLPCPRTGQVTRSRQAERSGWRAG
ncbi:hypothetical protein [Streptomyces sp. NPDC002671]